MADYTGEHSPTQVSAGQPVLCVCHILSLPGDPVLVRLHPKKDMRELNGGKMIVYPIVGGSRTADADKSDHVPVDVEHPDAQVWRVRPQAPLAPGEYALMLGTQNLSLFAFGVRKTPAPDETTFLTSAACWSSAIWAARCWIRSIILWPAAGFVSLPEPSWTQAGGVILRLKKKMRRSDANWTCGTSTEDIQARMGKSGVIFHVSYEMTRSEVEPLIHKVRHGRA